MYLNRFVPEQASLRGRGGFTLVELLVVIGIVAILCSMLLPAVAKAKGSAHGVQCLGNVRQLSLAWLLYADEHDGRLCPNTPGLPGGWVSGSLNFEGSNRDNTNTALLLEAKHARLGPYVQDYRVFKCPSDKSAVRVSGVRKERVRSVSMNMMVGLPSSEYGLPVNGEYRHYQNASQILKPSPDRLWVFIDEHPDSIDDGSFVMDLKNRGAAGYFYSWPGNFHGVGANLAFADGHVERHRWVDARTRHDNLYCGCLSSYASGGHFTKFPGSVDIAWLQERTSAPIVDRTR